MTMKLFLQWCTSIPAANSVWRPVVAARLYAKQGLKPHELPTGQNPTMPDFIIIGAHRCGSTSLYKYLVKHPAIAPAVRKEIHFFDRNFRKGVAWYQAQFPSLSFGVRQILKRHFVTGEATPYYMFHPHVPRRIFEAAPQAKIIAVLRNPIDRALSHYHHVVALGREPLPCFEDAIEQEEERVTWRAGEDA